MIEFDWVENSRRETPTTDRQRERERRERGERGERKENQTLPLQKEKRGKKGKEKWTLFFSTFCVESRKWIQLTFFLDRKVSKRRAKQTTERKREDIIYWQKPEKRKSERGKEEKVNGIKSTSGYQSSLGKIKKEKRRGWK